MELITNNNPIFELSQIAWLHLSSIAISLPKLQLYIGCSGWSYSAWSSHFYPAKLESKNYLEYYSKVIDYVEIDSSFYKTPSTLMTSRWAEVTSDNFKFTAKISQEVTHKKRLGQGIDDDMHCFTRILSLCAVVGNQFGGFII